MGETVFSRRSILHSKLCKLRDYSLLGDILLAVKNEALIHPCQKL